MGAIHKPRKFQFREIQNREIQEVAVQKIFRTEYPMGISKQKFEMLELTIFPRKVK